MVLDNCHGFPPFLAALYRVSFSEIHPLGARLEKIKKKKLAAY